MAGLDNVARTFDFEWKAHHEGRFEQSTLWGRTPGETWNDFLGRLMVPQARVEGAIVLDAGCGSGQFTRQIGEHDAGMVVGLDVSDAVDEAFEPCRTWQTSRSFRATCWRRPSSAGRSTWSGAPVSCTTRLMRRAGMRPCHVS